MRRSSPVGCNSTTAVVVIDGCALGCPGVRPVSTQNVFGHGLPKSRVRLGGVCLVCAPPCMHVRLLAQGEALPLQYVTPKCQRIDCRLFWGGEEEGVHELFFDAAVDRDAAEVCKPEIKI